MRQKAPQDCETFPATPGTGIGAQPERAVPDEERTLEGNGGYRAEKRSGSRTERRRWNERNKHTELDDRNPGTRTRNRNPENRP